jgi:hypothetical protein
MFNYYPSGTSQTPTELNDIVTMSQGERGILEFKYKYPGNYMFHAHKTEFAEKGWMGVFKVVDYSQDDKKEVDLKSNSAENPTNVSVSKNQSYLVADSSQNGVMNTGLENNMMAYNYTSYKFSNNSLHNSQQQATNPNEVISSYQYRINSSQTKE